MSRVIKFTLCTSLWVVLTACGGDGVGSGPDGGMSDDGSITTSCPLRLRFVTDPQVPGIELRTDAQVDGFRLEISDLRVVSDTSTEDYPDDVELVWGFESSPSSLCFEQASPGRYQRALFDVHRYRIEGELDSSRKFVVDDLPPNQQIDYRIYPSVVLDPGGSAEIVVEVRLGDLVNVIDNLGGSGDIDIDSGSSSSTLDALRYALDEALEGSGDGD